MVKLTISKRGGMYVLVFELSPGKCLGAIQVEEMVLSDDVIADVLISMEDGAIQ